MEVQPGEIAATKEAEPGKEAPQETDLEEGAIQEIETDTEDMEATIDEATQETDSETGAIPETDVHDSRVQELKIETQETRDTRLGEAHSEQTPSSNLHIIRTIDRKLARIGIMIIAVYSQITIMPIMKMDTPEMIKAAARLKWQ